jgi:hypothetical protein
LKNESQPFDPSDFWNYPDWDGPLKQPFWMRPLKPPKPKKPVEHGGYIGGGGGFYP